MLRALHFPAPLCFLLKVKEGRVFLVSYVGPGSAAGHDSLHHEYSLGGDWAALVLPLAVSPKPAWMNLMWLLPNLKMAYRFVVVYNSGIIGI